MQWQISQCKLKWYIPSIFHTLFFIHIGSVADAKKKQTSPQRQSPRKRQQSLSADEVDPKACKTLQYPQSEA